MGGETRGERCHGSTIFRSDAFMDVVSEFVGDGRGYCAGPMRGVEKNHEVAAIPNSRIARKSPQQQAGATRVGRGMNCDFGAIKALKFDPIVLRVAPFAPR